MQSGQSLVQASWDFDLYLGTDLFTESALFGRAVILAALEALERMAEAPRDREAVAPR